MSKELTTPAKVLIGVVGVGLLAFAAVRYGWIPKGAGGLVPGATPVAGGKVKQVSIDLLYGTEKEKWLKDAVDEFAKKRPDIEVRLKGMGTIESVRAIADGKERPTVWSPADDIAAGLLETEWSLAKGSSVVEKDGDLAAQPLVITPLVMIAWEERAKTLSQASGGDPTSFAAIHKLATNPKGWLGLGGPAEWGFVKLGHTAPNASNSGLQTLILMAYAFHGKSSGLKPQDVLDEKFQKWMKETETAVGKFGTSSGTYMKEMILFGPSKYDVIWNYESAAIGDMASAQGRWGNLSILYPKPTLWSNHPFVFLKGDWVSAEQRAAAKELRTFLLSAPVQERALAFGFRPANPDVKVLSEDPNNPFNRLKAFGVKVDIPPTAEPPSGEVTRLLLETWRRVVGSGLTP